MLYFSTCIQKFAKNLVILWLYSCFVTYMHKKLWDLTRMLRLRVIPAWVQPQATNCYVDSCRVWCYVCCCALSLVPCIFFTRLLPVYNIDTGYILLYNIYIYIYHIIIFYILCIWNIFIWFAKKWKNIFHINFYFLLYYWLCC